MSRIQSLVACVLLAGASLATPGCATSHDRQAALPVGDARGDNPRGEPDVSGHVDGATRGNVRHGEHSARATKPATVDRPRLRDSEVAESLPHIRCCDQHVGTGFPSSDGDTLCLGLTGDGCSARADGMARDATTPR